MGLSITEKVIEIARQAYVEPHLVQKVSQGDGLASFVYNEINTVTEGEERLDKALENASEAIWKAAHELMDVAIALENEVVEEEETED